MTIQQLEYFIAVARSLNFTKTAESFFISQSAITQQIKNLERELKIKLFYRKNRNVTLTNTGELFLREAESILEKIRDSVEKVQAVQNGITGNLSIGYLKSMEMTKFPKTIQNFHQKYPSIRLTLTRDDPIQLYDDFINGKYDIIFNINHRLFDYSKYEQQTIGTYPFYIVMHPDHPLAHKDLILQKDLAYEKLIIHNIQRHLKEDSEIIPEEFKQYDFSNNIIKKENDIESILIMVAAGIGISILPEYNVRSPQINLNLTYIPLDTQGYQETISVITKDSEINPLISLFKNEV